ncbi:MAG: VOC family protein [Pseudomonadota bacterium]
MSTPEHPFHLAFPVNDLEKTRRFYHDTLACPIGRESDRWIDFNFFGHQITAHLVDTHDTVTTNPVDGDDVPVRHFGAILSMPQWQALADRLTAANTDFVIEPHIRFKGEVGEQATLFFYDPCGNALEFKAFNDPSYIFAQD